LLETGTSVAIAMGKSVTGACAFDLFLLPFLVVVVVVELLLLLLLSAFSAGLRTMSISFD